MDNGNGRTRAWLDSLSPEELVIAQRVIDMAGGGQASAYVAVEMHRLRLELLDLLESLQQPWYLTPLKAIGTIAGAAIAAIMAVKGINV